MSDWSKEAAQRFRDNKASNAAQDAKTLSDRDLVNRLGQALWDTLCAEFGDQIDAFNGEPGVDPLSYDNSNPLIVKISRKDPVRVATITFNREQASASVDGPSIQAKDKKLVVRVSGSSQVQFFNSDDEMLPVSVVVQGVLDPLLKESSRTK
jgi:hypothetical protein